MHHHLRDRDMDASNDSPIGMHFYVHEFSWFVRLGVPLMATYFFNYLQLDIAVAFAGRLRKEELDAWGLAMSFYNMVVVCQYYALGYALSGRLGACVRC